ncbi:MAG: hypothetical protein LBF22_03570 [Deltaproteobacteria bacterium]|jgi:transposase|nr:hypothetical protein [Deltaproteobacteria bacterium]
MHLKGEIFSTTSSNEVFHDNLPFGTFGEREKVIMETRKQLEELFTNIWHNFSERERRLFAASQAKKLGYGGITLISSICGLSRATISKGIKELEEPPMENFRVRRPGAGRPALEKSDPELSQILEDLLVREVNLPSPHPISFIFKSTRTISNELTNLGHPISYVKVGQILKELGYQLKVNKKKKKDRIFQDSALAQERINKEIKEALERKAPIFYLESNLVNSRTKWPLQDDFPASKSSNLGGFVVDIFSEWWFQEGSKIFPHFEDWLFLIHDSPTGGLENKKNLLSLGKLSETLGVSLKVLFFPAGTHRFNVKTNELFTVWSRTLNEKPNRREVTRASLVSQDLGETNLTHHDYLLEFHSETQKGAPQKGALAEKDVKPENLPADNLKEQEQGLAFEIPDNYLETGWDFSPKFLG